MKKFILISITTATIVALGFWYYNHTKTIRPFEEVATEELRPYKDCHVEREGSTITISTPSHKRESGCELLTNYNLSEYKGARFTIENCSNLTMVVYVNLSDKPTKFPRASASRPMSVGNTYFLKGGEKRELRLDFPRPLSHPEVEEAIRIVDPSINMLHTPYSHAFNLQSYSGDLSNITQILINCKYRGTDYSDVRDWKISDFKIVRGKRAENPQVTELGYDEFFPFIDCYGQYKHHEWSGKIHSDEDLQLAREKEEADLSANPAPSDRNKYGGWASGPRHEATGRFYLKKVDDKWWFIDPEGCLWWSHGVVRVTPSSAVTPLDNRHFYFENLPAKGSEEEQFYYTHDALLKPYYTARNIKETYDFSSSNCYRKYGKDYKKIYAELAHRRLLSWGFNTIANSSDKEICLMSRTPYIERLEIRDARQIEGSGGAWWRFMDPWDSSFKQCIIDQLKERAKELNDPYLVGLFVDNELKWGDESFLAASIAQNPASLRAKQELIKYYKHKYGSIEKLNKVWGTSFASWSALSHNREALPKQAHSDLVEFNDMVIEKYFRNCREVFDEYAPGVLYLGCRFSAGGYNKKVLTIGAKYCDAISYNIYNYDVDEYKPTEGFDKPMIIGEFHFGTMDMGMFHYSIIRVDSQKSRGEAYANYVRSALKHPNIVGAHWHQFSDQATSGRFDGENFNVGLTDVCDTPYYETIDGVREVGYDMYNIRSKAYNYTK